LLNRYYYEHWLSLHISNNVNIHNFEEHVNKINSENTIYSCYALEHPSDYTNIGTYYDNIKEKFYFFDAPTNIII
jgi:hypothetical protein